MGREDEVRLIAYKIWQEEDCPNGRDCQHWFKAETIWEQQQKPKTAIKSPKMESESAIEKSTKVIAAKKKSPRK